MGLTRRQFLGSSATAMVAGAMAKKTVFGANDRIGIALIGCGSRGRSVTGGMMSEGAQLTHLCDLHPGRLDETWAFLSDEQEAEPKFVKNAEEVLASDEVDAVVVATPDHWHAPLTVLVCQAGKDVYVEKPHSHNIFESRKMVEAAEKYDCLVQVGMQNRSGGYVLEARELIRDGMLGEIPFARVFSRVLQTGPFHLDEPTDPPEGFDWNTWLGPVPTDWPYHPRLFHNGWYQFWDFTGADIALDGVHQIDMALMLMGDPGIPKSVRCLGGQYLRPPDDSESPDFQSVTWEFDDAIMAYDTNGCHEYMRMHGPFWPMNADRIELYGEDRFMYAGRHGRGVQVLERDGEESEALDGPWPDREHYANFLHCLETREQPAADISIAHASNVMIHMANIAHRLGNISLSYDAESGSFDNDEANAMIRPERREEFAVPEEV